MSLGALALMAGCAPKERPPEATLGQFLQDIRARRADSAWNALSAKARNGFETRARELAALAGEEPDTKPASILFSQLELVSLSKPQSISVVSPVGKSELTLRVTVELGKSSEFKLVREGEGWKVDLLGSLEPFPEYGAKSSTAAATRPAE